MLVPEIGRWYKFDAGDSFEVVAYDESDGVVELQYVDGTIEEIDIEDWSAELVTEVSPPLDFDEGDGL
jgi:hypothetical protein